MNLRARAVDALRDLFGDERLEKEAAESPSVEYTLDQGTMSSQSTYGNQFSGLLSVSNRLVDRYVDYECLTGDTCVLTLNGPVPIKHLADQCALSPDHKIPLYTWDGRRVTVGYGRDARMVKTATVYRVLLDDGTAIRATDNHRFMRRDGSYVETKDMRIGESLMPLYLSKGKDGHVRYKENDDYHKGALNQCDRYRTRRVARMVAEHTLGHRVGPGTVVKHKDKDRNNCNPENLAITVEKERVDRGTSSPLFQALKEASEIIDENTHLAYPPAVVPFYNHKVVSIDELGTQEVYCLDVPKTHNYAIGKESGGVFCHNSMDEYPDIHCIAEGSIVSLIEGAKVHPMTIDDLAVRGDGLTILGFNCTDRKITAVDAQGPHLESRSAEVYRADLSNGSYLRLTAEHKCLTATRGYIDFQDLEIGEELISMYEGFDHNAAMVCSQLRSATVRVLEKPRPDGLARVYDVMTVTHNLVVNGVVVHNSSNDYFANDATQPNIDNGRTIWVEANDHVTKGVANTLLRKKLRLDDEMYSIAYSLVKYGNDFEELLVTQNGVVGLNYLPPASMRRVEQENGTLLGFVQDWTGSFSDDMNELRTMLGGSSKIPDNLILFEDWQVVHMRLRSTHRRSPYGFANADGARWIWKRLVMLEDATMIYMLSRAPSRFVFYVDCTDVPSSKVGAFLNKTKQDLKKRKVIDPQSGQMTMQFNPLAMDEDIFLPIRDGRELARIDTLSGPVFASTEPIEYFQRKLHGVLKTPREYLGQDGAVPGRAILSNEDIRAARQTLNIQKELRRGTESIIRVDMAARGVRDARDRSFEVKMTMPSGIYALTQYEVKNSQADYASRVEPYVSKDWIRRTVLKLSDEEIAAIEKGVEKDMAAEGGFGTFESAAARENLLEVVGSVSEKDRGDLWTAKRFQKAFDEMRRREDWRERESRKRHDDLLEKLDMALTRDSGFSNRHMNRQAFSESLRDAAFHQNGKGKLQLTAPGRRRAR